MNQIYQIKLIFPVDPNVDCPSKVRALHECIMGCDHESYEANQWRRLFGAGTNPTAFVVLDSIDDTD